MAKPTREYLQWLEENNFSPEDERLILKTATKMTCLWMVLSCIPTLGMFFLPLLINAWTQRKIIKHKSFDVRPGLIFSLFAVAMYISYILIIPWIFSKIAKKRFWGPGLRTLIKKGKVGNGYASQTSSSDESGSASASNTETPKKSGSAVAVIVILLVIALIAVILLFMPRGGSSSAVERPQIVVSGRDWSELEQEFIQKGIGYNVRYEDDLSKPANTVLNYTQNIDGTSYELVIVSPNTSVPDFSAVTAEAELTTLAESKDLTVTVRYIDERGAVHDSKPSGEFGGVESIEPAPGTSLSRGSAVTVTVRVVGLQGLPDITGQWHICEYDGTSLYLDQFTFNSDGTFSFYGMGYISVDSPTDLYLYGKYWCGAMGAASYAGTYSLQPGNLILNYDEYDYETDQLIPMSTTYLYTCNGTTLSLTSPWGPEQNYSAGLTPEGTNPDPITSATGIWYYFEVPEEYPDDPGGNTHHTVATYLTVYPDGTCSSFAQSYMNSLYGWFCPGGEWPTYFGTCTYDGSVFDIHYTSELQVNYDDQGNYLGESKVPCDIHVRLNVQMQGNAGTVSNADETNIAMLVRLNEFAEPGILGDPDVLDISQVLDYYTYN